MHRPVDRPEKSQQSGGPMEIVESVVNGFKTRIRVAARPKPDDKKIEQPEPAKPKSGRPKPQIRTK